MLFNSYIFILFFLPAAVSGYFILNHFGKYSAAKAWLLGMSLWFYAYFNLSYFPIIAVSIIANYAAAKLMRKYIGRRKNLIKIFALLFNLGVIFYFKYFDFFISNINSVFKTDIALLHIVLPLGISFFTFQQLSYVIDVSNGEVPDYGFLDYALFIAFFPQLVAGPIVTHDEIIPQFADKSKKQVNYENLCAGIYTFALGLAKKVIVADTFGAAVDYGFKAINYLNTANAVVVMIAYSLQIYFDFSGYCDMASGAAMLFNIKLPVNFNSPYKAVNIDDFWKRWHITLTRFFTKYVYLPLGGNRKGLTRTLLNVLIVFLVSGLWHGANRTFIIWGALHGAASVFYRLFKKYVDKVPAVINRAVTFAFVNLAWIFFRASSVAEAVLFYQKMFDFAPLRNVQPGITSCFALKNLDMLYEIFAEIKPGADLNYYLCFFAFAAALFGVFFMRNTAQKAEDFRPTFTRGAFVCLLLYISLISLSGVSIFLYFNF